MHKTLICTEKTEQNAVILSHESDVSRIFVVQRHSQELKFSTQNATTTLGGMRVLQFLFLPALMNLSLPCYSASNSWSYCFACHWDINYPLAHCIFNLNQKYMVIYFIMLQTTICILYLIKFFCHFPYDFCILHVPEHFNSYRTCNVMKEQKKWTQHGFLHKNIHVFLLLNKQLSDTYKSMQSSTKQECFEKGCLLKKSGKRICLYCNVLSNEELVPFSILPLFAASRSDKAVITMEGSCYVCSSLRLSILSAKSNEHHLSVSQTLLVVLQFPCWVPWMTDIHVLYAPTGSFHTVQLRTRMVYWLRHVFQTQRLQRAQPRREPAQRQKQQLYRCYSFAKIFHSSLLPENWSW